jgi:predicted DCC family thiol-disulfide oxidoreductase YuxK
MTPASLPLILYDGGCGFCHRSVRFVLRHERNARLTFASLASPAGQATLARFGLPVDYDRSVVLVEEGRAYTGSTGALRITKYLRWPWRLGGAFLLVPRPLRDAAYYFVALHRNRLPGADACALPDPAWEHRFVDAPRSPARAREG